MTDERRRTCSTILKIGIIGLMLNVLPLNANAEKCQPRDAQCNINKAIRKIQTELDKSYFSKTGRIKYTIKREGSCKMSIEMRINDSSFPKDKRYSKDTIKIKKLSGGTFSIGSIYDSTGRKSGLKLEIRCLPGSDCIEKRQINGTVRTNKFIIIADPGDRKILESVKHMLNGIYIVTNMSRECINQ